MMNQKDAPIRVETGKNTPETRILPDPDRWLSAARAAWWVIALVVLALNAASVPILIKDLLTVCPQSRCEYQLTAVQVQQMHSLGLSIPLFAGFLTAVLTLVPFFYIFVAFLIFQRKSAGWIGLLGAFTLVLFGGVTFPETPIVIGMAYPSLLLILLVLDYLGNIAFPLFVIVFPDGRLNPRWTLGLVAAWAVIRLPSYFFTGSPLDFNTWSPWIQEPIWVGLFGSLILVQYYRYRRVYGPVLRQQTKWVVFGLMVSLVGFLGVRGIYALLSEPIRESALVVIFANAAAYLLMVLIPVAIAMAILRYRLWDIDLLINRTLVYIPLTAILAGLYSASITLFQKIFIATTGARSDAALLMTTFVVVTTFTPVKNGLQMAVDKRFKESADPLKEIRTLDNQVRSVVEVLDAGLITRRLLNTAAKAFHASGGAIYLDRGGGMIMAQATPGWVEADGNLSLPLEWNGRQLGLLCLGAREAGLEYSTQERQVLQQTANRVARAIAGFGMDGIE